MSLLCSSVNGAAVYDTDNLELYLFDYSPWALITFFDLESSPEVEAGRTLNFGHF